MNLVFIGVLSGATALFWWLSGYDTRITGEDHASDVRRRALRTGISLLLVVAALVGGLIFTPALLLLAPIWAGCASELFTRGFHEIVDAQDNREIDLKEDTRDLDALAALVQNGRNDEAIELCQKLRKSGQISTLAIEAVLFRLYTRMMADDSIQAFPALAEIQRLRAQGNSAAAASRLESILQIDPGNLREKFRLMQIYARDLKRPDLADALVRDLEQQPQVPPGFADYARRSIQEWSGMAPKRETTTEGIETLLVNRTASKQGERHAVPANASIDELLAAGHLATAIELLERQIKEQPASFDLWLKLAEAHGVNCRNLSRAGKIVGQIEANAAFNQEQVQLAKSKLKEWRGPERP